MSWGEALLWGTVIAAVVLGVLGAAYFLLEQFMFVQAAWVVLIKPKSWERHGLKSWIEAARKRLHHNALAIALANKLARIAWSVLARGRSFEARMTNEANAQPA